MMRPFYAVLIFLALRSVCPAADPVPLTVDPAGAHDLQLTDLGSGEWEVRTTGTDPYFRVRSGGQEIDLESTPMLSFDYFSATGVGPGLVFVGQVLDLPHLIRINVGKREGWGNFSADLTATSAPAQPPVTSLRVTLGDHPGIVVRLRSLCCRMPTEQELLTSKDRKQRLADDAEHAVRLGEYLKRDFPHQVTEVSATKDAITVKGRLGVARGACQLAEIPMWEDITALKTPASLRPIEPDAEGNFSVTIERGSVTGREPLLSGWAVVAIGEGGYQLLSAMHYVDDQAARAPLPAAKPVSRKGLGGCAFDHPDIRELGIASVTLNIILNDLLLPEPGPDRTPYAFAGRTWYANDPLVADYDHYMRTAAERKLMVSAIVLLPPVRDAAPGAWIREAAHPDADGGAAFVMPDFTSARGVNAYAAAMNFVAERYSRPDGEFGRVHHWILHNEINSGFFWTSAGTKTALTYLDLYQKSMRVAFLLARQYDPNAKPLISLEHCWGRPADSRAYAGRDLMEHLVSFSRREGDFPWGIAFHPYPQDIFNPRTWEDSEASFDYGTPFITYKNIEVIDAWARQPRVAFRGQPREIQLSEQGLNSPGYSEKSLRDQAAGMAYAWKKIEPLPTITAFQYHLWADDRGEGGLRLGLRKFADDPEDPHGVKPIWRLYRDLETSAFDTEWSPVKETLGIQDWAEIPYGVVIQSGD